MALLAQNLQFEVSLIIHSEAQRLFSATEQLSTERSQLLLSKIPSFISPDQVEAAF